MIIRCTRKMRAELRLDEKDLLGSKPTAAGLDEWFCDLLRIDRQKYVLCTHARTLFSIVLPQLRRADMAHLATMLAGTVTGAMEREGFTPAAVASVVSLDEVRYGLTERTGFDERHRIPVSGRCRVAWRCGTASGDRGDAAQSQSAPCHWLSKCDRCASFGALDGSPLTELHAGHPAVSARHARQGWRGPSTQVTIPFLRP
jgi:hypothetical protein